MKTYATGDLRNICLVGPQGEGKTSIAEALLYNARVTTRLGRVEEGNTVCDSAEDETERKISINLSLSFLEHKDKKINLAVTPGYADFAGELHAGLAVCESALLVIGGDNVNAPALEGIWELLEEKKIPVAIFLNKLDKDNLEFENTIKLLKEKLSPHIVDIEAPDHTGQAFSSDVILLDENVPPEDLPIREAMVEDISSADDALTEEFLEGKKITPEELKAALKKEIAERKTFPVLCGSATKNIGIKELADFIADYMPAPKPPEGKTQFSGLVYKTISEPGMGQLNFVKVVSGSIAAGKDIYNFTRQARERAGQLCFIEGKKKIDSAEAQAGDLVAIMKLKDTRTNDILGDEKSAPQVATITFPAQVYERSITTQSKGDDEKVGTALAILSLENPMIKHYYNPETKEMVVAGMGALQLEIMAKKIKTRYGVDVVLKAPRVPYKETIRGKAEVQGKYKRQTGGHGQYGDCWLRIERLERGKGFEFENKVVGGVIPRNFIPAIEKGVKEALEQGVIAGYQGVDIRVTVYDGSYHDVDSSEMAFKIAGAMALKKGFLEARPVLLEPIMNAEIVVPGDYMGVVIGDLNSRRGRVLGMDKAGKKDMIKAQVPLSEMFQYAVDLRSLTKGSGKFSMRQSHYEDTPPDIANGLIAAYQKTREAEAEK